MKVCILPRRYPTRSALSQTASASICAPPLRMIRDILRDGADESDETDVVDGLVERAGFGFVILTTSVLANEAMIFPCRYQIESAISQTSSASITRPSVKCNSSARATPKFATEKKRRRDRKRQTRGRGDKGTRRKVEKHLVSLSTPLLVPFSLLSVARWLCGIFLNVRDSEVVVPGQIEQVVRQNRLEISVLANIEKTVYQVARLAGFHDAFFPHIFRNRVIEHELIIGNARVLGVSLEYFPVGLFGRRFDVNAVAHPSQEGFVNQAARFDVGREDDELFERHDDLFSGVQSQKVDPAFERDDPSVEQVFGVDPLSAEIIDHQSAAIGLDLERRLVIARRAVVNQVGALQSHLAADQDQRSHDAQPAPVI